MLIDTLELKSVCTHFFRATLELLALEFHTLMSILDFFYLQKLSISDDFDVHQTANSSRDSLPLDSHTATSPENLIIAVEEITLEYLANLLVAVNDDVMKLTSIVANLTTECVNRKDLN